MNGKTAKMLRGVLRDNGISGRKDMERSAKETWGNQNKKDKAMLRQAWKEHKCK
jgi:hypothetical protein